MKYAIRSVVRGFTYYLRADGVFVFGPGPIEETGATLFASHGEALQAFAKRGRLGTLGISTALGDNAEIVAVEEVPGKTVEEYVDLTEDTDLSTLDGFRVIQFDFVHTAFPNRGVSEWKSLLAATVALREIQQQTVLQPAALRIIGVRRVETPRELKVRPLVPCKD